MAHGWLSLPGMERRKLGETLWGGRATRLRGRARGRLGDARPSADRALAYKRERAFTLLELIIAMAVLAISIGIALPHAPADAFARAQAMQLLLTDLRQARADALTKGDHFRVTVTGATTYETRRLQLVGGAWVPSGPAIRARALPGDVTFASGVGAAFEFNTRGLLVTPDAATTLELIHPDGGAPRRVTVWPSGQVVPL